MEALNGRLSCAESRLSKIEDAFAANCDNNNNNDDTMPIYRIRSDIIKKQVYSYKFLNVSDDYYNFPLRERAAQLNCSIPQLCKSILFENTAYSKEPDSVFNTPFDITNSQYYLVIVQYIAKINVNYLRTFIHELRSEPDRLSKKKFQFQLAPTAISEALTGFGHNSVSPFGLKTPIPVIVCRRCAELSPPFLMLGGGEVHVKLSLPFTDLIRGCGAAVGDISDSRVEFDLHLMDKDL